MSAPAPSKRRLWAFLALNFAAVNAAMLSSGVPLRDTDLHPLEWFLSFRQGGDSWRPMNQAYDFARSPEGRTRTLYEKLFYSPAVKHKGFQYPPTALLAVWLARLGGAGHGQAVLEAITWAFVPATAVLVFLVYAAVLRRCGAVPPGPWPRPELIATLLLALFATLTFYPAMRAYRNGQIQTWINGLVAAALAAWLHDRKRLAGACAGAACLIKPQYALIAVWGLLRRERDFTLGACAFGAAGLLLSLALFGLAPHLEYLGVLGFIAQRGESFYPNQSWNGLLNRALGNGLNLEWMESMPAPHPAVYAGTLLTSALLLLWALVPRGQRQSGREPASGGQGAREPAPAADLAMIALAATVASPIAWEHHYGLLLPIFALLAPALAHEPVFGRATPVVLASAYVLGGHTLRITDRLADTPLNVLQSYMLAGALLVLLLLDRLRRAPAARPERR